MGTSRGTNATIELAQFLSDKIDGEIHTSSLSNIAFFDSSKFKNRHLLVHHRHNDGKATPFTAAEEANKRFGTELIVMDGGVSEGNSCEAFSFHGYNEIESETVNAIKQWIKRPK